MEEIEKQENYSEVAFQWKFPEFEKHERSRQWYIAAGIIIALLLAYSFITADFLFVVIIVLGVFILYLYHIKEVEEIDFKITDNGIEIHNSFYDWRMLKKFYIIYDPPQVKNLYLEFKALTKPNLAIPLEKQNPLPIREYLLQYLSEDREKEYEPATHAIGRRLKI